MCVSGGFWQIRSHMYLYLCDWIYKNHSKSHKNWNPIYCLTLILNSCAIQKHQTCGCIWPSILSQTAFYCRVKPPRCITESVEPVNSINKDVSGDRLLPTTVSTYPVEWVCFCHLLKTQNCCLCPNGRHNPSPGAHPLPPLITSTPTTHHFPSHLSSPYNVLSVIL